MIRLALYAVFIIFIVGLVFGVALAAWLTAPGVP